MAVQEHQRRIRCCPKGNPSRKFANPRSFYFEMMPLARKVVHKPEPSGHRRQKVQARSALLTQHDRHDPLRFDSQFIFDRVRKLIEPEEIVLPTRVSNLARRIIEHYPSIGIKRL
jgi:hypothetical protein